MTTTPRKHNPAWADNTRTARSAKRTKADDDWAAKISGGKYTTLRRLMTAIHNGEIVLTVKVRTIQDAADERRAYERMSQLKGKQS